jgi:two-component system response regulator AtoC
MAKKSKDMVTILVVDDDEKIRFAFKTLLKREGYRFVAAASGGEALELSAKEQPALVFMDITMPNLDGLETLARMRQENMAAPVILITGHGTMQTAIHAMQLGAFDYLTKPLDIKKIRDVMRRAITLHRSTALVHDHRSPFKADFVDRYELVGNSPTMQEVYKTIGSVAMTPHHTSVLIVGESGTGKELVARAIHHSGPSATEPFAAINCAALPETLLESELFGHEKGAFTGAFERKLGKFEMAHAGTIFLDEISSLSIGLQQKLLRVLQEREFERLGGNEKIAVLARFVAATNVDLETEVQKGDFRKDLFFRLNVVTVHLPPLRDRPEDIPILANYFLKKYSDRLKKRLLGFSSEAISQLTNHPFPGNVRQLENIVERAVIFTKGEVVLPDSLQEPASQKRSPISQFPLVSPVFSKARDHYLKLFEAEFLREKLKNCKGNVSQAAKSSGMTRHNFQRLMKKHKIHSEQFR